MSSTKIHLGVTALIAIVVSLSSIGIYHLINPTKIKVHEITTTANQAPQSVLFTKGNNGSYEALDFSAVAAEVTPAVVHIKSKVRSTTPANPWGDMFGGGNPFEEFFRQGPGDSAPPTRERFRMGSGSGVIISTDGYIVTNNHVIDDSDELEVNLNDKRSFSAKVIGTDPTTDLALIKIDAKNLPVLNFGNSDQVKIGQWVMAVGNPFDLTSTVTAGIVSATGRNINILREQYAIESFIQTDAAINPGNSGGALVDLAGNLVGINTAISSPTGSYSGYGFAVPANLVAKVISDLRIHGTVQRGVLGVLIRDVNGKLAEEKSLKVNDGVYVDSLINNSAAADAGIKPNDVIVAIDNQPTPTSPTLQEAIATKRPGDVVNVKVNRDGKEKSIPVTLKNREGTIDIVKASAIDAIDELGAEFEPVSDEEARKLNIDGGMKVVSLSRGKLRSQTTIEEGFVITKMDGKAVKDNDDIRKLLKNKKGGLMIEGYYPGDSTPTYYAIGM